MNRDSFVFYKSWGEAIELLPETEQAQVYRAIVRYACTGEEQEMPAMANVIFTLAKPQIDANNKRYEDGRKGGRPKKPVVSELKTSGFENENQWLSNEKPNVYVYDNDNANAYANANDNDNASVSANDKDIVEKPEEKINYQYIIDNLNGKAGRSYRVTEKTRSLIRARFREGFTEQDFLKVIDNKVRGWANDPKMSKYLRPETLFGTKFEGYLQETHRDYVSGDLPF